jgi:hypothetical protein
MDFGGFSWIWVGLEKTAKPRFSLVNSFLNMSLSSSVSRDSFSEISVISSSGTFSRDSGILVVLMKTIR